MRDKLIARGFDENRDKLGILGKIIWQAATISANVGLP